MLIKNNILGYENWTIGVKTLVAIMIQAIGKECTRSEIKLQLMLIISSHI